MSLSADQKAGMYDANAKLCRAVQQHPCIYDRSDGNYVKKDAYDAAWADIARQCDESVSSCKVRWRNIRTAFIRSVQNKPKKRTPNRTREYYLHDVLEFFLPHIVNLSDGEEARESEDDIDAIKKKADSNTSKESIKEEAPQSPADGGESTSSAEETTGEEQTPEKQSEKHLRKRSKINTFYIAGKQSKLGTFYIKKISTAVQSNADEEAKKPDISRDSDTGSDKSKKDEPRFRFRRNCKRGLDKTVISQLRVRKREPEIKRQRRGLERLKAIKRQAVLVAESNKAQLNKAKLQATKDKKVLPEAPVSMKSAQQKVSQSDVVETQMTVVAQSNWRKTLPAPRQLMQLSSVAPTQLQSESKAVAAVCVADKAVQCNTLASSMDEDFLNSLKPYMNEMNARQKLHFKKKVYESLMEVFDSSASFPGTSTPLASPQPPPTAVQLLTSEELSLVRELAAVVQAAKQTPELMAAASAETKEPEPNESVVESVVVSDANAAIAATSSEAIRPQTTQQLPNSFDAATVAASNAPRHYIRKLVQVSDSSNGSVTTQKGEKRRIYRIFPSGRLGAAAENASPASNVGTFIIPRTAPNTNAGGAAGNGSPAAYRGTSTYRKISIPASAVNWAEASILRAPPSTVDVVGRRTMTVRGRVSNPPRQLVRRYSICGVTPGMVGGTERRPTKIITTSVSTQPTKGNAVDAAGFKVPNLINTTTTAAAAATTSATVSKSTPTAAPNTLSHSPSASASAISLLGGRQQFMSFGAATVSTSPPCAVAEKKPSAPPIAATAATASPERVGVKRSLRLKSSAAADRRNKADTQMEGVEQGQTAGTIASDNFAGLHIKPEPMDDNF